MADVTVADRSQLNAAIANARAAASTEDDRITISGATPTTNTIAINTQLAFQGSPTTGSLTLVGNLNGSSSVAVSGFTGTNTATFTGTLTQAGGIVTTDASRVQLNGSLSASGVAFNAANGSVLRVAAGSQITNTSGIVIAGGGAFTVVNAGTIADGDGSDVINTSAAVTLLNTGTISNRTNVAAGANGVGSRITNAQSGVLAGGSSQQFGAGANLGNNGTIDNYGTISGSAALASNAGTLSGGTGITANLYAGSSTGTVRLGAGSTLSLYTGTGTSNAGIATTDPLTGQAVTLQNAGTNAAAIVGRIALGSSGTLALRGTGDGTTANGAAGTLDISTVSGATTLNKSDTGTFVLTGVYGSALATNVTAGTLNIRNAGALGTTGTTAVSSGATLQLQNTIAVGAKPLSIAGSGSGMANGALQNVSDANTYAGAITLSAAARINVDSGSLSLSGGITGATSPRALTLGGAGGTGTVSSVIGTNIASVTKDGANTWVLTGANTYTGGTTIGSGTLQLNNSGGNALANDGRVTFANDANTTAQLTASTSETIGSLTGGNASSTVSIAASQTLTVGGDGTTDGVYAGVINANGTGRLSKTGAGTQTLTGNSTAFTGTVAVTAGTLAVNGTLGDTANRAATITVGDGTVGSGTLGGSGTVAGSVNILNGGTISAGNSPGTLSTGNLTLATGATLTEEVTGTTAGAYDQVNVTGSVSLAGTLDLRVTGTFASTVGQNLVFINNDLTDTVTGRFDALRLNGASVALSNSNTFSVDGRSYQLNYQAGDGNDVAIRDITPAPFDPGPPGPTPGNDNLVGTAGPDTISLGQGADTFSAGGGADLVYGNQGDDLIYGNLDNDTIYGGQDNDRVYGGQGDDRLFGNAGNDVLFGNLGNDIVYGNQGNDIVYGNQGADILFGGQGNDVLYGGQGEDTLVGGIGDDILVGGLGADRYVFGANSGRDLILGFNQGEGDRLALGGQTYTVSSAQNGDALLTLSGGGVVDLAGIRAEQVNANYFAA